MTAAILSLVTYLLPLLVEGIRTYAERQKGANHEANVQEFRKVIAKGNNLSPRLADQHDRVLSAVRGSGR